MRRGDILAIALASGLLLACDGSGSAQAGHDTSPGPNDASGTDVGTSPGDTAGGGTDADVAGDSTQAGATDVVVAQNTTIVDTGTPQDIATNDASDSQGSCGALPDAMCVTACGADSAKQPVCETGAWKCPQGTIFADACPPDTCIGGAPPCCDVQSVEVAKASCEAATWTCPGVSALDCETTGGCPGGQVPTVDGCTSCADVAGIVGAIKAETTGLYSGCISDSDCILVSQDTACAGACPTAIGAQNADAFAEVLAMIDGDYCSAETVATCGYATPDCAPTTPKCNDGACEATPNVD